MDGKQMISPACICALIFSLTLCPLSHSRRNSTAAYLVLSKLGGVPVHKSGANQYLLLDSQTALDRTPFRLAEAAGCSVAFPSFQTSFA